MPNWPRETNRYVRDGVISIWWQRLETCHSTSQFPPHTPSVGSVFTSSAPFRLVPKRRLGRPPNPKYSVRHDRQEDLHRLHLSIGAVPHRASREGSTPFLVTEAPYSPTRLDPLALVSGYRSRNCRPLAEQCPDSTGLF